MLLIPAIDIKNGQCVRLKQGDLDKNITVYNQNPVDQAARWARLGARRIHIVDLDGAKTGEPVNAETIARMVREIGASSEIEVGGGIRSMEQIRQYVAAGVKYFIIGTAAVRNPDFLKEACAMYPSRVIPALDARDGIVATEGWVASTGIPAVDLARKLVGCGAAAFLYTDITRDGMLTGVNAEATAELALASGVPVIASGGMATIEDIRRVLRVEKYGVVGAVLGRSLYEGTIDFSEALALVKEAV